MNVPKVLRTAPQLLRGTMPLGFSQAQLPGDGVPADLADHVRVTDHGELIGRA